jgi:hypothetical protein
MKSFKTVLSASFLAIFMAGLPAVSSLAQDTAAVTKDNAPLTVEEEVQDLSPLVGMDNAETSVADVKADLKKDKTGTNPLNFTNDLRLYNEYRWLNTEGDGGQNLTTLEFRTPFASGKWQFRAKIRGVFLNADLNDDGNDDIDESGFGDTDIRFGTVPYFSMEKKMGVFAGVEFFLPTASEDALGSGAASVAPFAFLAFFNPIGPGSILVPGYQQTVSFYEEDGRDRVNQGLIDLFLVQTFKENKYWAYVDPQVILDYENDEEFMLIELQGGMMVGAKGHSIYAMPSFGVGGDRPYDFSIEVGYKIVW